MELLFACIFILSLLAGTQAVIAGPSRPGDSGRRKTKIHPKSSPPPFAASKLGRLLSDGVAALTYTILENPGS